MSRTFARFAWPAAVVIAVIGCRSVPVEQAAPAVDRIETGASPAGQMAAGRAIYVGQCAHCHQPKPVYEYTAAEWKDKIMPRMAKKAKLSPEESQTVLAYVLAARQVTPPQAN